MTEQHWLAPSIQTGSMHHKEKYSLELLRMNETMNIGASLKEDSSDSISIHCLGFH